MRLRHTSARATYPALLVVVLLPCPSSVVADVRPGLAIEGSATVSNNPLLIDGSRRGAAIVEAGIRPSLEITDDTGLNIGLNGLLAGRHYSRRYDDVVHGNVQLTTDWRKNEWLSLSALAQFSREPLVDRLATDIDASVTSTGLRTGKLGTVSLAWKPDSRTRIEPEFRIESGRYSGAGTLSDTRSMQWAISASRRTSAYTTLGTRFSYSRNRVEDAPGSTIYSGFGTLEQRMSHLWRLRLELGLEQVHTSAFQSASGNKRLQASGNGELCRDSPRLTLCANGGVASEVSGLGGLQRRFELGGTARWRLTRRLNASINARYQRATQQGSGLPSVDAAQARLRLDRRINSQLTASAIAEYSRREVPGGPALSSATVGIQLKYEPLPL